MRYWMKMIITATSSGLATLTFFKYKNLKREKDSGT